MRTVAIVQARMTSTRLPGKVLERLGEGTVLAEVLRRCARIPGVDAVCCAAPDGAVHDAVAAEAERCGARVVRGDETDVLARYRKAAETCGAELALRVTSDCPLIDAQVCGAVLALAAEGSADYAANNLGRAWPHGYDCEAFTRELLETAAATASEPHEREHVTPWMRSHPSVRRANLDGPGGATGDLRVTLDFPEDLAFLRALFAACPGEGGPSDLAELTRLLAAHPELAEINAMHRRKSRPEPATEVS